MPLTVGFATKIWITNIQKSNNNRMSKQLGFHSQKIIPATSIQDLNPRPCADNAHTSVLPFEIAVIEPGDGEIPTCKLTCKLTYKLGPLGFLRHIKCRTIDDRFRWHFGRCGSVLSLVFQSRL
jgi:hypothetical protein